MLTLLWKQDFCLESKYSNLRNVQRILPRSLSLCPTYRDGVQLPVGHGSAQVQVSFLLRVRSELWGRRLRTDRASWLPLSLSQTCPHYLVLHTLHQLTPQKDNLPLSQPNLVEEEGIKPFCPSIGPKLKKRVGRRPEGGGLMGNTGLWVCSVLPPTYSRSQQVLYLALTSTLNSCGAVHLVSGSGGRGIFSQTLTSGV